MKTIAMKCASCGAGLQIAPDIDHFACGYCGASLSVVRQGGTVTLRLVTDLLAKVQVGTDRTAAELALVRLPKEISERRRELDAIEEQIREYEAIISDASLPKAGNRKSSLIANHAVVAIVKGGAMGLFIGFFVNWFFQAWFSPTVGVFVGLFVAVGHALNYFNNPLQVSDRLVAGIEDDSDKLRRQSAPFVTEELKNLQQSRIALNDRLQKLNMQLAQASVMVDS